MRRRDETHQRLQAEIAGEKAAALGRAGEQLESALHEVARCAIRLRSALNPHERVNHAEAYQHARARALQARLRLLIQREALGLRRHAVVDQQYPEPPSVAQLLGTAP
jgi:hypothetical protein